MEQLEQDDVPLSPAPW